jgi:hypothetical protein
MEGRTPQQWAYSALVGMSLLLAGWMWQIVGTLRDDVQRMQELKADRTAVEAKSGDRWTGAQQAEYRQYVESRLNSLQNEMDTCRHQLETEIDRYHPIKR